METTVSHQVKVGVFVIIGLILFCVSVILLGGDRFFLTRAYSLKVRMPQIQGLVKGSVVSLIGVPVGNIEKVDFVGGSNEVELTLSIQQSVQSRITEGSLAMVKTQGALGDKYVYIEPGPTTGKALADGAILETDKTPDFLDIIASKGAEMGEIVEVIKEVRVLMANINHEGRSAKLMGNLVETTGEMSKLMVEARETFKSMRNETMVPLASVMKKLDRGQGTLGALINDPTIYNRLSTMLGEAPRNKFLKPLIRESIQTNEEKK